MVCMPQMAFQCHQDDSILAAARPTAVTFFFSSPKSSDRFNLHGISTGFFQCSDRAQIILLKL